MALESLPKIAPALFSPEQDLIQIYNKKSDTLGVINASLIGGNTPPSGVSGAIQFSNGSAFASDATQLFWDDTNNRLGVGTNAPTEALDVVGQSRFSDNILFSTDFKHIGRDLNNSSISFSSINSRILAKISTGGTFEVYNSASGTSRFAVSNGGQTTISGGGSTSATTSLLVQNSSGNTALTVKDDLSGIFTGIIDFQNNVNLRGANFTQSTLNMRFVVPGATKTFLINADYGDTNAPSAILEVQSTTKGFLPPRMTDAQIRAIASPVNGLVAYNTTISHLCCYQSGSWVKLNHSPM